jgi:hypothetical protein
MMVTESLNRLALQSSGLCALSSVWFPGSLREVERDMHAVVTLVIGVLVVLAVPALVWFLERGGEE